MSSLNTKFVLLVASIMYEYIRALTVEPWGHNSQLYTAKSDLLLPSVTVPESSILFTFIQAQYIYCLSKAV